MIFEQLFDPESSTYTYIIADPQTREAAIIDPVLEQSTRDLEVIARLKLKLLYSLETHLHADHITGAARLREELHCKTAIAKQAKSASFDVQLSENDRLKVGKIVIDVLETPGHTDTCLTYKVDGAIFTGDALFINGCGRTDFQNGDSAKLYDSVTKKLFTLPDGTLVYPAHDYNGKKSSTVGQERQYNARLSKDKNSFITLMANLKLDPPKKIKVALPANLAGGNI